MRTEDRVIEQLLDAIQEQKKELRNLGDAYRDAIVKLPRPAPEYDVAPLKRALTYAGISSPESEEELAVKWAEYAQMVIRYVEAKARACRVCGRPDTTEDCAQDGCGLMGKGGG
jgi:hypothetical protein